MLALRTIQNHDYRNDKVFVITRTIGIAHDLSAVLDGKTIGLLSVSGKRYALKLKTEVVSKQLEEEYQRRHVA